MEKLFNWTIGSFFRTIGRLIAYFAIGAFIAYILSNSNIKLPRITNLFLDHVSAAVLTESVVRDGNDWLEFSSNNLDLSQVPYGSSSYWSSDYLEEYIYSLSSNVGINADYVGIHFMISQPLTIESTTSEEGRRCLKWTCSATEENSGPTWKYCTQYTCTQYGTWTQGQETIVVPTELKDFNISFRVVYSDNTFSLCQVDGAVAYCPTNRKPISDIRFSYSLKTSRSTSFKFTINRNIDRYKYTNVEGAINNQTQQQQQQHNETMTIITDTNTTSEQNNTISFFEGFEFSSDNTGLVGVITAPLRVINSIVNAQFSDLCFTLKSKNVCFPNGNMIWQKSNRDSTWFGTGSISSGIQALVSLFNLVAGGYILYKMGVSIKRLTEDLINPTNTRIEVMKL